MSNVMEVSSDDAAEKPGATQEETSKTEEKKVGGDVVVLDDEGNADCDVIDLVRTEMTGNTKCINYACKSGANMFEPPGFCLSFYRVRNKINKRQQICSECYEKAIEHYDTLMDALMSKTPLLDVEIPFRNDVVEIDDSDSEEETEEECAIDEHTMDMLTECLGDTLMKVMDEYDFNNQVKQSIDILHKNVDTIKDSLLEVQTMFKSIRTETDSMIFELSNMLRPDNVDLPTLEITDKKVQIVKSSVFQTRPKLQQAKGIAASGKQVLQKMETKILPKPSSKDFGLKGVSQESDVEKRKDVVGSGSGENDGTSIDLPPKGTLVKPQLKIGEIYYASRLELVGAWVKVRLSDFLPAGTKRDGQVYSHNMYWVTIENRQRNVTSKIVSGKEIAYSTCSPVQLEVGTRVVAVFHEVLSASEPKKNRKDTYYPGIIAESLQATNNYRYLIFFDDGYAHYVTHNFVFPIYEASKDVWEDVNINSRAFIKKYLENYPDRPMVKLMKDQTVLTEYNGKWWVATVMDVDCSLVKMFFDASSRVEWIYRGSTRLNPMFKEEQAATSRLQHRQRVTRKIVNSSSSAPYVQYTRSDTSNASPMSNQQQEQQQQQRSVARKSTSKPVQINNSITSNTNPFLPDSNREAPATKIVYYTPRRQKPKTNVYVAHNCGPKCKDYMYCALSRLKGYSPLSKPLLCGFYRLLCKIKNKKSVIYKAPCGRTLRNMPEVHLYLRITKSDLTVDLFDFNVYVRCLAEFMVDQKNVLVKDLSQGLEECPITVVNYVDSSHLNFCNYSTRREPMEGVELNLDPEFLCGCDCTDDCIDRSKCACWQLTLNCLKFMDKDTNPETLGYQYRRLPEPIFSGIYECNSKCKCASTCLNRVVQNPLQHKLQVFKTDSKGWGIRCLNDIPQGSFVCIYAGALLTDHMANEGGKSYGDEYLAELDFIETVERAKEDYEEEAYSTDNEKENTPEESAEESAMEEDDDEDVVTTRSYVDDRDFIPSIYTKNVSDYAGIGTRLRKRNVSDAKPKADTLKNQEKQKAKPVESSSDDTVTISDDEDYAPREPSSFNPKSDTNLNDSREQKYKSVREMFGEDEAVYIMDAKNTGNIGRFLNHSCTPNIFVQNVFVDTQDVRFPWVAFFAMSYVRAGSELTWNYNYDVGSVPGKVLYCYCGSAECKGRLL